MFCVGEFMGHRDGGRMGWWCWLGLVGLGCWLAFPVWAAGAAGDIAGVWWSPRKDAKIEMSVDTRGVLTGRLIAMPEKTAGNTDVRNPDTGLRSRSLLGLVIFSGFRQESAGRWGQGKVYDAETGATFQGQLWFEGEERDRLMVRGYVGLPLLGRTEIFQRVSGSQPQRRQTGEPLLVHLETTAAARLVSPAAP